MFFQTNKIDGTRLSRISSDFLDSIGMLDVDKTVFYLELQKLYGKSSPVKLKLGKQVKTKKVVTVTENTRVVYKDNGTLVIKTGPEIKKVEIVRNSDETYEEIDQNETHSEKPDKSYLMNKYLEENEQNRKKEKKTKKSSLGNGVKKATINAFQETSRDFFTNEMPTEKEIPMKEGQRFRVENITPASEFPIVHGLW